jgi:hypothetical protein
VPPLIDDDTSSSHLTVSHAAARAAGKEGRARAREIWKKIMGTPGDGGFEAPEVDIDEAALKTPALFGVEGKNVFVTGGARGIGLMIAAGYALNGARVAISSRDGAAGERAVVRLNELGPGGCFSVPGDLSRRGEIDRVLEVVSEEFDGSLHVLVNNSGAAGGSRVDNYDMDEWDSTLNLNVSVPMYMTGQCMKMLEAAGTHEDPSSVIMVGSTDALKAPGGSSTNYAYSTSKAGPSGCRPRVLLLIYVCVCICICIWRWRCSS